MTRAAWFQVTLRQPWVWFACGALLLLVLLGLLAASQRNWHDRAAVLERENTGLQLSRLAGELTAQSEGLAERTRELAESDAVLRLLQDTADTSAERLELTDMSRHGVDALLVLSATVTDTRRAFGTKMR